MNEEKYWEKCKYRYYGEENFHIDSYDQISKAAHIVSKKMEDGWRKSNEYLKKQYEEIERIMEEWGE